MARLAFIFICVFAVSVAFAASPSEPALRAALQDLDKTDGMTPEAARQVQTGLKVLLTTGYAKLANGNGSAACDALPIIPKPYRHQELAVAVRAALDAT